MQKPPTQKEKLPGRRWFFWPVNEEDLEHQRKRVIGMVISLIGISTLIPFGIPAYRQHNPTMGLLDHLSAFINGSMLNQP